MGRLIALAAVLAGLVFFAQYYDGRDPAFAAGYDWALDANGFFFWFTIGLLGFLAAHAGGGARLTVSLIMLGVGALFAFLATRQTQLPELREADGPVLLAIGLAVAYAPKPEKWMLLGAAALGGAAAGFRAGRAIGVRLDELSVLGGFFTALAVFFLGGMVLAELCGLSKAGASIRTRVGAGAAGIGLYLTLQPLVGWI